MLNPTRLAEYVERSNEQVLLPPYMAEDAWLWIFLVKASLSKLDRIVQKELTTPTGGTLHYSAAADWVALVLFHTDHLRSDDPRDMSRGWTSERELSVWIPAWDHRGQKPVWFVPHIFTSNPTAVTTGREVYGYPKAYAEIRFERDGDDGAGDPILGFTVRANATRTEDTAFRMRPVVVMSPSSGEEATAGDPMPLRAAVAAIHESPPVRAENTAGQAKLVLMPGLRPPPTAHRRSSGFSGRVRGRLPSTDTEEFLSRLVNDAPLVFLKQFRDATHPTKACFQAVIEANVAVEPSGVPSEGRCRGLAALPSLEPIAGPFTMWFARLVDLNLADELGLETDEDGNLAIAEVLRTPAPVRMAAELGQELWQWHP